MFVYSNGLEYFLKILMFIFYFWDFDLMGLGEVWVLIFFNNYGSYEEYNVEYEISDIVIGIVVFLINVSL